MNPLMTASAAALVRHGLQLGAGYLLARGLIDQSMVNELVGAGVTMFTVAWSLQQKRHTVGAPAGRGG